jgi:hypothetical protein
VLDFKFYMCFNQKSKTEHALLGRSVRLRLFDNPHIMSKKNMSRHAARRLAECLSPSAFPFPPYWLISSVCGCFLCLLVPSRHLIGLLVIFRPQRNSYGSSNVVSNTFARRTHCQSRLHGDLHLRPAWPCAYGGPLRLLQLWMITCTLFGVARSVVLPASSRN